VLAAADGEAEIPEVRLLLLIISLVLRSLLSAPAPTPLLAFCYCCCTIRCFKETKATMDNGIGVGHPPSRIFGYLTVQKKKGFFATFSSTIRCWFVKKYCWLVCLREKYCFGWKFPIVYDKPQPIEQADNRISKK